MLMLDHAREVSRNQLAAIPTPAPTPTWRPVPHHEVVSTLIDRAHARGLRIASERFALLDGAVYPQPGQRSVIPGARLYGSIDFEEIPGVEFPPGCKPSAGVRNSHDKSFSLSILAGSRVIVCANGLLLGEHLVRRKHTAGIALFTEIDKALDAFMETISSFRQVYDRLRSQRLTRSEGHHLIVLMARAGAFPSSDILRVADEWEEPRHPEFRELTAWSLHQAATENMRRQSPGRQTSGFMALSQVLLARPN